MVYGIKREETVPTCTECGCRLAVTSYALGYIIQHFWGSRENHDARGCRCKRIDMLRYSSDPKLQDFVWKS